MKYQYSVGLLLKFVSIYNLLSALQALLHSLLRLRFNQAELLVLWTRQNITGKHMASFDLTKAMTAKLEADFTTFQIMKTTSILPGGLMIALCRDVSLFCTAL